MSYDSVYATFFFHSVITFALYKKFKNTISIIAWSSH